MNTTKRIRNLAIILFSCLVLFLKQYYSGPFKGLIQAYGSNILVSFAIYFLALVWLETLPQTRLLSGIGSLLIVELFELLNGIGPTSNTFDPMDFIANALGITLALVVDLLLDRPGLQREEGDD